MNHLTRPILIVLLLAALGLAALPFAADDFYILLFTKIMALAIFAMSLDLLLGHTGLVSFGHAAYMGVAAYVTAVIAPEYDAANLLTSLPLAVGVAALAALVIGALVLRTSGVYFIMVTLAFGQMAFFVFQETPWFGGSDGKLIFAKPVIAIGEAVLVDLSSERTFYYMALIALVVSFLLLRMIARSPFGRVIQGIRVNEARMRGLGCHTYRYKLASFVIAGAFAGLAGFLVAYQAEYVSPALLGWKESGMGLMMVILGGSGTLYGPAFGALALVLLQEWFAALTEHWMALMGVFVVLVVIFFPNGLAGALARLTGNGAGNERRGDD